MPWSRFTVHSAAAIIWEQVDAAKGGATRIVVTKECLNCGMLFSKPMPVAAIVRVEAQRSVGEVTVDLALIGTENRVVGAIIFDDRHRLPAKGLEHLQHQSIPWIIAEPTSFVTALGNKITWHPKRSSRPLCDTRVADRELSQCSDGAVANEWTIRGRVIRRISQTTQQPVPEKNSSYWAEPFTCWTCSTRMLVFTWMGREWMTDAPPPDPRPGTIQYRYSKTADDKYWVNVCPHCNSIQGDNYVFAPAGPLHRPTGTPTNEW